MFEINRNICSSLSRREIEERMIDEVRNYLQLQLDGLLGYVTDYFLVINGRYLDIREEVAGDTDEQGQVVRGEFGDVHVVHGENDHLEKKGFVISPRPSPRNLINARWRKLVKFCGWWILPPRQADSGTISSSSRRIWSA